MKDGRRRVRETTTADSPAAVQNDLPCRVIESWPGIARRYVAMGGPPGTRIRVRVVE
jgi:hypothetical protein